jgi:uncharacterized RDD family membrane protein YckC
MNVSESIVRDSRPLDTTITVSTPENVAFDFRLAGPFPRFLAFVVDCSLLFAALILFFMVLGILGGVGIGLFLIVAFLAWWGYGGLMETFFNGQTLGKRALGIRVVSESGLAINGGQGILRNILRSADLVPPFFPGVASMLLTARFQRLGDLAAETMVVIDRDRVAPRPSRSHQNVEEIRSLIPARFRPDTALAEALAAYMGCRSDLSVFRRRELAQTLASHFIQLWGLPPTTDPDGILCAIYDLATLGQDELNQTSSKQSSRSSTAKDAGFFLEKSSRLQQSK